jgi:hypothetical protein
MTDWRPPKRPLTALFVMLLFQACDKEPARTDAPQAAASAAAAPPPNASPEPPRAPDILVDQTTISVGQERLATGEPHLDERLAGILKGESAIQGRSIDFVAMRNAKPSLVASIALALRRANASSANVKTESRDGATVKLALSFSTKEPDCAAVAWIARDGAIDVWPAGGATAQRVNKGLAGPDMTLGTEAVERQAGGCTASELIVGADDRFPWGLVFDLATSATQARGSRTGAVILTTNVVPGRKVSLE